MSETTTDPGEETLPVLAPFAAILVMAGSGRRFGSPLPKVFVPLAGLPMWQHAAETLSTTPGCAWLVLVTEEARVGEVREVLAGLPNATVVAGGRRRQDSVRAGLAAVPAELSVVAVHDAARPLVRQETVIDVVNAAARGGAAIAAAPARDTVKRVAADGRIVDTLDRTEVWLAPTPQAFQTSLLRTAHDDAAARGDEVTDDAALVELSGVAVHVVPGDPWNIKITEPGDLAVAMGLMAARQLAEQM